MALTIGGSSSTDGANFALLDIGMQTLININPSASTDPNSSPTVELDRLLEEVPRRGGRHREHLGTEQRPHGQHVPVEALPHQRHRDRHDRHGDPRGRGRSHLARRRVRVRSVLEPGRQRCSSSPRSTSRHRHLQHRRAQRRHEAARADRHRDRRRHRRSRRRARPRHARRQRHQLLSEHQQRQQAGRVQPEHLRDRSRQRTRARPTTATRAATATTTARRRCGS